MKKETEKTKEIVVNDPEMSKLDGFNTAQEIMGTVEILMRSKALPQGIKNAEQATMIVMQGKELGFKAVTSLNNIFVIQGRVVLSIHAINALLKTKGIAHKTIEEFAPIEGDDGNYRTTIRFYRKYPELSRPNEPFVLEEDVSYTWREATRAGLTQKQTWTQYPRVQLWNRCFAFGARRVGADVLQGTSELSEMLDVSGTNYKINSEGEVTVIEDK